MGRELINANITHVSYVDKAANQKKFFLTKSDKAPTFQKNVQILTKAEDEQQLVYGVVYEPDVVDSHGDAMNAVEIEKAAHLFMKEYQNIDKQHDFVDGAGELVESYVAPADFEIGGETITKGSWVIVTKATDEVWEQIKKGEVTGYSMGGTAEVIEKADAEAEQAKSLLKTLKSFFLGNETQVTKGEVQDKFNSGKKQREFWDALYIFEDVFYSEIWNAKPDVNRIKEAAVDFGNLMQQIADQPEAFLKSLEGMTQAEVIQKSAVMKAGKKISASNMDKLIAAHTSLGEVIDSASQIEKSKEEEVDVKKEELQAILKEALDPINEKITALEKNGEEVQEEVKKAADETTEKVEAAVTKEELADVLKSVLAPIAERLETVEKARGIKKSETPEGESTPEDVQKSEGVFDSLFKLSR